MTTTKRRTPRKPAPDQLAKREAIFNLYRDLGPTRSYERLIELIRPKYGDVSKRTLVNWSRQHNWQPRVAEYDDALATGSEVQAELDPNFNATEALLRSAHLALQRALASHPMARTPQDYKALVDAAEKALRLVAKLRELGMDGGNKATEQQQVNTFRTLMAEMGRVVRAKDLAEGHPVQALEPVDVEVEEVMPTDHGVSEAAPQLGWS